MLVCVTCAIRRFVVSPTSWIFISSIFALVILPTPTSAQTNWTHCAAEGGQCGFSGTKEVRYGANGQYFVKTLTNGTACTNAVFGDPIYGTAKQCEIRDVWTFCAAESGFCNFSGTAEVRYGANGVYAFKTLSNGTACTNGVFGDPLYGVVKQCHLRQAAAAPPPPPPPVQTYGPQTSITCPVGAVDLWPGTNIQSVVNLYAGATTFCVRPGVHHLTGAITPKSGNTFVGQYGAVLDGGGWTTTDQNQGAFRSHNQDINDVTIRNLVIRNMPQRGIHAYYASADRWTIEYNEITGTTIGVSAPNNSTVRRNFIHHNSQGGYSAFKASNTVFEANEIAHNGSQKTLAATNITFRNNFVHHNTVDGIWFDGGSSGGLIEGNTVEDNTREGIFVEISAGAVIRNNTSRRNGYSGIMISTAKNIQVYNNTLQDNFRGIQYFLNCSAVGEGSLQYDLSNNTVRDNVMRVGTRSGSLASGFSHVSSCSATQVAPYLNRQKGLTFTNNDYDVPVTSTKYFFWGFGSLKSWGEWQGMGHDTAGSQQ
jgi:parallel beta-helix repeat protein